ncbi:MAG TPA: DUF6484 domain-containing protein [Amaricoccus sp.]|jgi:hypothetical protein|nr:DUF6484 domain-containing protein [Amaricoccus sp.]
MAETAQRIDGVAIGVLMGFDGDAPLVVFPGNPREAAVPARSIAPVGYAMIGAEVALMFEDGDPLRPLIVGRLVEPARGAPPQVFRDGEVVRVTGGERIELRCGSASLIMEKDGRITLRGTRLVSHASGTNRIRGGSVQLN